MEKSDKWERKWMVFDESALNFYKGPINREGYFTISMDKVISFRADVSPRISISSGCFYHYYYLLFFRIIPYILLFLLSQPNEDFDSD
jgi:hypothetical protein